MLLIQRVEVMLEIGMMGSVRAVRTSVGGCSVSQL